MIRRCQKCHSPRSGQNCFKCGSPTVEPHKDWVEPALPDVQRIRALAREVGYAIGVHGSLERDLDVIAAPWTETAIGNYGLMEHIAKGMNGRIVDFERKPLGRYAATIQVDGYFRPIDLSVCPRIEPFLEADLREQIASKDEELERLRKELVVLQNRHDTNLALAMKQEAAHA